MELKQWYKQVLNKIFSNYNLSGCFTQSVFEKAIDLEDFYFCYLTKETKKLEKELLEFVNDFIVDFPKAKDPFFKNHFHVSPY